MSNDGPDPRECAVNTPMGMKDDWCHFGDDHPGDHSWSKENQIRYFYDLTDEEADEAVGIVFRQVSDDYESGKIELIFQGSEAALQDELWSIASGIVENAVFIPDDGAYVVRL